MNKFEKCQVIMLPTEKSNVHVMHKNNNILRYTVRVIGTGALNYPQHLYILSNDDIEEGDIVMHKDGTIRIAIQLGGFMGYRWKSDPKRTEWFNKNDYPKKVIATTDPELNLPGIPATFIHSYCVSSGSITEIMVEYEEVQDIPITSGIGKGKIVRVIKSPHNNETNSDMSVYKSVLKVAPDNTIIIHPIKQTFTRSEVEALLLKYDADLHGGLTDTTLLNTWINKNL